MKIEIIREAGALDKLKDWNILLKKSESNTVFLTHEWIKTWWLCFGEEILLATASDRGKLIGIAPLMIVEKKYAGLKLRELQFIGTPLSDYADFIISNNKKTVLRKMMGALLKEDWDILRLRELPEGTKTVDMLKNMLTRPIIQTTEQVSVLVYKGTDLKQMLNKRDLKRKSKHLAKKGEIEYIYQNNFSDTEYIESYMDLHQARWNKTKYKSMFNDARHRDFFVNIAKTFARKKWMQMLSMTVAGEPVSHHYDFLYNGKKYAYSCTFKEEFDRLSPGLISLKHDIEQSESAGHKEYDLTRGTEFYKSRFTNTVRKNREIVYFKNPVLDAGYRTAMLGKKIIRNFKR